MEFGRSPNRYPSVTANADLSFFRLVASAREHGAYQTRAKGEKYTCLTKSGLYDLRGEIVTKNTRLFIGRCRNIDCAAVKNSQYKHPDLALFTGFKFKLNVCFRLCFAKPSVRLKPLRFSSISRKPNQESDRYDQRNRFPRI